MTAQIALTSKTLLRLDKLIVLTFSDKPLPGDNYLKRSCERQGLQLEVITHTPWEFNAIKIKLLHDWLQTAGEDTLILVLDAFDVAIYDNEEDLLKKYHQIEGDVIFSAESNYYFRNKQLVWPYWKAYPRQGTIYDYLNSGTYMGRAADLRKMIEKMIEKGDISLEPESLRITRSDQYAFSKHYVDSFYSSDSPKIRLDHQQKLMGCSGGRFSVMPFPDLSKMQAFLFFLLERNLLKAFSLHQHQSYAKDFIVLNDRFYNKKTKQAPSVIHFPGTWENFNTFISKFLDGSVRRSKNLFAISISLLSYVLSLALGLFLFFPKKRSAEL